jgi:HEAT repeat protein
MGWAEAPLRRRIRLRLEEMLSDPNYRVLLAAIEALGDLAEPAARTALRRLADATLDGRTLRRAREALGRLEEGGAAARQVRDLRDSLEEARGTIADLRRRVEALEKPGNGP